MAQAASASGPVVAAAASSDASLAAMYAAIAASAASLAAMACILAISPVCRVAMFSVASAAAWASSAAAIAASLAARGRCRRMPSESASRSVGPGSGSGSGSGIRHPASPLLADRRRCWMLHAASPSANTAAKQTVIRFLCIDMILRLSLAFEAASRPRPQVGFYSVERASARPKDELHCDAAGNLFSVTVG